MNFKLSFLEDKNIIEKTLQFCIGVGFALGLIGAALEHLDKKYKIEPKWTNFNKWNPKFSLMAFGILNWLFGLITLVNIR
jgi:hypothetical protein